MTHTETVVPCPLCNAPVPVRDDKLAGHGKYVLGWKQPYRRCKASGTKYPPRQRRSKLGNQIQKALREPATKQLPLDPFEGFRADCHVCAEPIHADQASVFFNGRARHAECRN